MDKLRSVGKQPGESMESVLTQFDPLSISKWQCWWSLFNHPHTHTFNGPLSGTTQVSQYQKGKTNLDFTEARDSEWQWHQLGHMQVHLAPDISAPAPHHSVFYRPDALPVTQPTVSKH